MNTGTRFNKKSEVQIIHDLAHRIWPHTFKDILSIDQIEYMLNRMYALDVLENQISNGHQFLVWQENNLPVGFIGIELNYPIHGTLRIHKIYILPEMQGTGLGKKLINVVGEIARENGCTSLNLNVNRFNNAVSFYQYLGFAITKEEDIDIGNGYLMEDFVMEMKLGNDFKT